MKYKTLFRLVLKLIGVYLIAQCLSSFVMSAGYTAFAVSRRALLVSVGKGLFL